jgi:hypothetical protein
MFYEYRGKLFKNVLKSTNNIFLFQYCVNIPGLILFDEKEFVKLLSEKKLIQAVNKNILHYHPDAKDSLISNTYARSLAEATGYTDYSLNV